MSGFLDLSDSLLVILSTMAATASSVPCPSRYIGIGDQANQHHQRFL